MKKNLFVSVFFVFVIFSPVFSKTVRVGYYIDSGNFMSGFSEADPKAGYSYEYMQTIAGYTGWNYEYVYGEWDDLYTALLNGDIDLLSDVSYTEERKKLINYPDYVMGQESYYLYSNNPDLKISPGDFSTWKDISIGLREDGYYYDLFMNWQKDKNLDCKYVEFSTSAPYYQMFKDHEFDLLMEIDMVAEPSWNPIVRIGTSDFYLAVTKSRPDILKELNYALAELFSVNPYYNSSLWFKYFSDSTVTKTASPREAEWLKSHPQIIVGCMYNDLPFSAINEENHNPEGLVVDLMDYFSSYFFKSEDSQILYAFYNDYDEMLSDLNKGVLQVVAPVVRDLNLAEKNNLILSEKLSTVIMGFVSKENAFVGNVKKIAIPKNLKISDYVKQNYPKAQVVIYDTYEKCVEAVLRDEVDGAIFNIYKMRGILGKNKRYSKLKSVELSEHCDMAFVLTKDNTALLSVLNKMLMLIPEETTRSAVELYSAKEIGYTRKNFVKDYLGYFILALVVFVFVLFALLTALQRLREYVEHDTLTKLLNRKNMDKYVAKAMHYAVEEKECFSLLLFDLDNFKRINDVYGHAFGDRVLVSVAESITKVISGKDKAIRWGGEEFLVICNGDENRAYIIAERIRQLIDETRLKNDSILVHFTTTIGVATYTKGTTYKDMFRQADEKLYEGKHNGKNQVVI
ncbi:MAG: GGDEF domain-containing protein [Treponema sp.]|nr:GGDEF domain-containing protein [Treponema sp.]